MTILRLVLAACLLALLPGCGDGSNACRVLCKKDIECHSETLDEDTCVDICKALADDDDDYRTAVEERADCYEDDLACNELVTCDRVSSF